MSSTALQIFAAYLQAYTVMIFPHTSARQHLLARQVRPVNKFHITAYAGDIRLGKYARADPSGSAVLGVRLKSFDCWDREFDSAEHISVRLSCLFCAVKVLASATS